MKNATDRKNGKLNQLSLGHPLHVSLDILLKQLQLYIKTFKFFYGQSFLLSHNFGCVKWNVVEISWLNKISNIVQFSFTKKHSVPFFVLFLCQKLLIMTTWLRCQFSYSKEEKSERKRDKENMTGGKRDQSTLTCNFKPIHKYCKQYLLLPLPLFRQY